MVKDELELLNDTRKEKNKSIRAYEEVLFNVKLSTVIDQCFGDWSSLSYNTETTQNYKRYIKELNDNGILFLDKNVNDTENKPIIITQKLLNCNKLSNMQKKIRMHALIHVFRHIEKESLGKFKPLKMPLELSKIGPIKDSNRKAATYDEVIKIINASRSLSLRDSLVFELIYYTQRPLLEVLKLKVEQINFEDKIILKTIVDEGIIERLKNYFESTMLLRGNSSNFFISNNGKLLCRTIVQKTLTKANKATQSPFTITTKMIQRSQQSKIFT